MYPQLYHNLPILCFVFFFSSILFYPVVHSDCQNKNKKQQFFSFLCVCVVWFVLLSAKKKKTKPKQKKKKPKQKKQKIKYLLCISSKLFCWHGHQVKSSALPTPLTTTIKKHFFLKVYVYIYFMCVRVRVWKNAEKKPPTRSHFCMIHISEKKKTEKPKQIVQKIAHLCKH